MKSSFQRKVKSRVDPIAGCFPSLYTHHLLTSTGVPDLDQLVGGGLPIGTILMIEEDFSGGIAKLLLKYFLSEGVIHKHALSVSGLTQSPESIVQNLPSIVEESHKVSSETSAEKTVPSGDADDRMKIAWRYQKNSPQPGEMQREKHSFNLQIPMDKSRLKECSVQNFDLQEPIDEQTTCKSIELLRKLTNHCNEHGFIVDQPKQGEARRILRIAVHSLGDILWGESPTQIVSFLLGLKALLRTCFGVVLLTIPPSLHETEDIRLKLRSCVDFVVSLNSFDASETVNPAYKDYHGIIALERISCLGVLTPPLHLLKEDVELVYKSRRNRFVIEKFHLPPDLSENVSRDFKDPKLKKNIDF